MHRESRPSQRRLLGLLAAFGLLLAAVPGCGDEPIKKDESVGIPKVLKDSNDRMQNFMKSQAAAKKK
jgi:hypothetical protein